MDCVFNKFDDYDKLFFELVLKYENDFEKTQKSSTKYKLELTKEIVTLQTTKINAINKNSNKKTEHTVINFGFYDYDTEIFRWHGGLNQMMKEHVMKYGNLFDGIPTIDKIMDNTVMKIPKKYCNIIPYFLSVINPAFNLVRFSTEDSTKNSYILVTLNLTNHLNFDEFVEDIDTYKKLNIFKCV